MSKRTYIVDLDGTVAKLDHRLPLIQGEPESKDWDAFFDACTKDEPIRDVIDVIRAVAFYADATREETRIIYLTGRPERIRLKTAAWILTNKLPNGELVMRKDGDHRPDTKAKKELMQKIMSEGDRIAGIFEDRPAMCRVWRELGLTVFQLNHVEF